MIKKIKNKTRKLITLIKVINDIAIIALSVVIGYGLKFKLYVFGLSTYHMPSAQIEAYLSVLFYILILWLFSFGVNGMYKHYSGPLAKMNLFKAIFKSIIFGVFEVMAFTFIYKSFPGSRYVLIYSALVAVVLLSFTRNIIYNFSNYLHRKGLGNKRTVIVGNSIQSQRLAELLIAYPEYGFNLIGFIADGLPKKVIHPLKKRFLLLGKTKELERLLKKYQVNAVFLAEDDLVLEEILKIDNYCKANDLYMRFMPTKYLLSQKDITFEMLDSIQLVGIKDLYFPFNQRLQKRLFDLLIVVPLFILTLPLMLFLALLVKITSPGPVIYKQKRVTENGREFDFYKFRSMRTDAEKDGCPVLSTGDQGQRTTRIGNLLRKSSLDELPQLINILMGDMSIVGPRPERPYFNNKYKKTVAGWENRLLVKGGLTGWAQVNGRAELSASPYEKLNYDVYYVANWSIFFDLKIILDTFGKVLLQKDVY